ncbi:hypothetical protein K431DRAFT_232368 [Polychaeton citri CBS 116435]|uniref:Uncharacterized protein n=1 Tax=Polychaeton citri CBS 116435 TaxID=1314669 RepID=A0A9P4UKR9_9PEZI|nr:hypothetical protein K431DRAFT_232368 [Polychaeton citri CBS 116435]
MVLGIGSDDGPKPKCFFHNSQLPSFINHEQPPTKKRPFSIILDQAFSHCLDVVVPSEVALALQEAVTQEKAALQYARVHMKLGDIIEGDFFNTYIKSGNVLMLSEGRSGVDQVYSLRDGILRLELDRPTFERTGFEGNTIPNAARKHVKTRFEVLLNLRQPSMVRGRKGFDRIVWAFANVLNQSVAWLFKDLKDTTDGTGPIADYQRHVQTTKPQIEHLQEVRVPQFPPSFERRDFETATDLLEWLSFALGAIPRIQAHDNIDDFLCAYRLPKMSSAQDIEASKVQNLTCFRWHGFATSDFVTGIFLLLSKYTDNNWFAMGATSFDGHAYTILKADDHTMIWQYAD